MDESIKKQIGIYLLIIVGAFGSVILETVINLEFSPLWVIFIGIAWYATDILISFLVFHYFKAKKEDIPVIPTTTELKTSLSDNTGDNILTDLHIK